MTNETFQVGDLVNVLNAIRLPKVEEVRHTGRIYKITFVQTPDFKSYTDKPIYWIEGLLMGRSAFVLRRAE